MRIFRFLALILTCAAAAFGDITSDLFCLDPHTYTSRSGDYTLHVDPHHPIGHGPATYTFTHLGNTLWKREHPFAYYKAVVTDEGIIGGAAMVADKLDRHRRYSRSTIVFAILSREGEVLLDDRTTRRGTSLLTNPPSDTHSPSVRDVMLLGADTMVVDLYENDKQDYESTNTGRTWRFYSLQDAHFEKDIEIHRLERADGAFMHLRTATTLPNAPLILAEWKGYGQEKDLRSSYFTYTLHNRDGEIVWSYKTHAVPPDKETDSLWYHLDLKGHRRFAAENDAIFITSWSEKCTRSFSVCFNPQAETLWEVQQIGTQEWIPPANPRPMIKDLPQIALQHLGSVKLRRHEVDTGPPFKIAAFTLSDDRTIAMIRFEEQPPEFARGCDARLFVPDETLDITVHHNYIPVRFVPQSEGLWSLTESAPDAPDRVSVWRALDQPDGDSPRQSIPPIALTDALGYLIGAARRPVDAGWWMIFDSNKLCLVASDGHIAKQLSRTSDNTWIRPGLLAVATDGSLALQQFTGYAIFGANGDPLTTIPFQDPFADVFLMLRSDRDLTSFIFNGRWVMKPTTHGLLLAGIDAEPRGIKLLHSFTFCAAAFSPDGTELLFLRNDRSTIDRYALPD